MSSQAAESVRPTPREPALLHTMAALRSREQTLRPHMWPLPPPTQGWRLFVRMFCCCFVAKDPSNNQYEPLSGGDGEGDGGQAPSTGPGAARADAQQQAGAPRLLDGAQAAAPATQQPDLEAPAAAQPGGGKQG